ncbi:MAG: hypothetical protein HND44_20585 [Chloroflexi bacterium]|nr:hypothetical protein [Ardenticatenaceae bacterium]MBL1130844.1 hypothetical protein [Chloroflexota bacterium]NOG36941.1 hypothetical protein [Chloroflexota bacterium]
MDDQDVPYFTKGCANGLACWQDATEGYNGHSWFTTLTQLGDWARWRPALTHSAEYDVYVHIPDFGSIRTYEARYSVQHAGGLKNNLIISQNDTSGVDHWYFVGRYKLNANSGLASYVRVVDTLPQGSEPSRQLLADAVKFVRLTNPVFTPTPTYTPTPSRTPTLTPIHTPTAPPTQTPTSATATATPGANVYFVQPASVEGIVVLFNHTPPACSADTNSIQCSGTFPHNWANAYYAGVHGTFSYHQDPSQAVGFFFTATAFDSIAEINLAGRGGQTDIYIADNTGISSPLNEVVMCFGGRYSLVPPYWEYNHFNDQSLFECDYVIDRTAYSDPVTYFNSEANTLEILAFSQFEGLPHEWSFAVHDFGYLLYGLPPTSTPTPTVTNTPAGGTFTPLAPSILPTRTPGILP